MSEFNSALWVGLFGDANIDLPKETRLEQVYRLAGVPLDADAPDELRRYRIRLKDDAAVKRDVPVGKDLVCDICGHDNRWVFEGPQDSPTARFECGDHEPIWVGYGTVRPVRSVQVGEIAHAEEVGTL